MTADVRIAELTSVDELREVADLFATIWEQPGEPPLNVGTLRALSHSGNYVAGARSDGRLVGGVVGWLGGDPRDHLHMHSHILGVLPGTEARGVGFSLKQHQRAWCLERGVTTMEWTFDPLVRRNAHFNLTKLGADAVEYLINFYGQMDDGLNAGEVSDRLLIRWTLDSPKAVAAAEGVPLETQLNKDHIVVAVPEDIVAIRRHDPELARRWRQRVRDALGGAMARGYRVAGLTRNHEYVLEPH